MEEKIGTESDKGAEVERTKSDAEEGPREQPDPDKDGPHPDDQDGEPGGRDAGRSPPPDDLAKDPAYEPRTEGLKGIKGG